MLSLSRTNTYIAAAVAIIFGMLFSWWPLTALAILILILGDRIVEGVGLALVLDIAFGAPPGPLHILYFPFTFGALLLALSMRLSGYVLFDRRSQETL